MRIFFPSSVGLSSALADNCKPQKENAIAAQQITTRACIHRPLPFVPHLRAMHQVRYQQYSWLPALRNPQIMRSMSAFGKQDGRPLVAGSVNPQPRPLRPQASQSNPTSRTSGLAKPRRPAVNTFLNQHGAHSLAACLTPADAPASSARCRPRPWRRPGALPRARPRTGLAWECCGC